MYGYVASNKYSLFQTKVVLLYSVVSVSSGKAFVDAVNLQRTSADVIAV
jgi:hypothetical protein